MSEKDDKVVVRVNGLKLGVKDDDGNSDDFRFIIDYGSFDIRLGDFVIIKGRNGCGKSTFLRLFHLQGIHYFKVTEGEILFCDPSFPKDTSIHNYSQAEFTHLNRRISFIGQEERFLSSDSAYSYIYNVCALALEDADNRKEKLRKVDEKIKEYYDRYLASSFLCKDYKIFKKKNVRAWSGGQQKMINVLAGLIKAEICGLRLVVMDEPLNNLDGRNKAILNALIRDLRKNGNIAVLAITHCQIFDEVNKVLLLEECADGIRRATLRSAVEPPHSECIEEFKEEITE